MTVAHNGNRYIQAGRQGLHPRARHCQDCACGGVNLDHLLVQLRGIAAAKGVSLAELLPDLRTSFHRARSEKDQRAEHRIWVAIVAITSAADNQAEATPTVVVSVRAQATTEVPTMAGVA